MKYWSKESKNLVVANKILDCLKIPDNCGSIRVLRNETIMTFHKRAVSNYQTLLFATPAVPEIAAKLIIA